MPPDEIEPRQTFEVQMAQPIASDSIRAFLASGLLAAASCLPRTELSGYSSRGAEQDEPLLSPALPATADPELLPPVASGDAAPGEPEAVTRPEESTDATEAPSGAAPLASDEGVLGDASPLADECARTGGILEPGSAVCLFFDSTARVTWQAAASSCESRGSTLVAIETSARDDFLTSLIGNTAAWIGANDPGTDPAANDFIWRDGSAVDLMLGTWAAGEPDDVADQFCVLKSIGAGRRGGPAAPWRDRPCSELNAYVCEQSF
jgi:hypothetical protein